MTFEDFIRITPACAGKTQIAESHLFRCWDHPRVCGKNKAIIDLIDQEVGSPPRVREKLLVIVADIVLGGITPACAGKTRAYSS